jgi:hypothetical protein
MSTWAKVRENFGLICIDSKMVRVSNWAFLNKLQIIKSSQYTIQFMDVD